MTPEQLDKARAYMNQARQNLLNADEALGTRDVNTDLTCELHMAMLYVERSLLCAEPADLLRLPQEDLP